MGRTTEPEYVLYLFLRLQEGLGKSDEALRISNRR